MVMTSPSQHSVSKIIFYFRFRRIERSDPSLINSVFEDTKEIKAILLMLEVLFNFPHFYPNKSFL
jgi:hypothetical protein